MKHSIAVLVLWFAVSTGAFAQKDSLRREFNQVSVWQPGMPEVEKWEKGKATLVIKANGDVILTDAAGKTSRYRSTPELKKERVKGSNFQSGTVLNQKGEPVTMAMHADGSFLVQSLDGSVVQYRQQK
jgi:hypothetical protein